MDEKRIPVENGKVLEKPIVTIGSSGVSRVNPADILRSRVGQAEINKTATIALTLGLTKTPSHRSSKGT